MSIKYLALLHDAADWRAERQAGMQAGRCWLAVAGRPISSATVIVSHTRIKICQNPICSHRTLLPALQDLVTVVSPANFHEASKVPYLSCASCLSSSPVTVAVFCLSVLHVSNLTKLFRLNQYLCRDRGRADEDGRKEAHNVTGRRLEEIAGCVRSLARCLQKERIRKEERHEWRRFVAPRNDDGGGTDADGRLVDL